MSVYLFHGDKGGVGKSMLAATFLEYLLSRELPTVVVDGDRRNGDVARLFEQALPTISPNLRERSGWLDVADLMDDQPANDVVIVLPGNIGAELSDAGEFFRDALRELKRSLATFFVLNRSVDSVNLLRVFIEEFPEAGKLIAVRNLFFGDADRFTRWNASNTRAAFLKSGGKEMDFEELLDSVVDDSFAAKPPRRFTDTALTYAKKLTLRRWLDRNFAAFDSLSDELGVGKR